MGRKPVHKNLRTKTLRRDQGVIQNKIHISKIRKSMTWILGHSVSIIIGLLIGYFYFWLTHKKDFKPIEDRTKRIEQKVSQLSQDFLNSNDYIKYIEVYQRLYKSVFENSFTEGYITLGARDSTIFSSNNYNNKIKIDATGSIDFNERNCVVKIVLNNLHFVEKKTTYVGYRLDLDINNYEIGKMYRQGVRIERFYLYIAILSDNIANPVFVLGFSKN